MAPHFTICLVRFVRPRIRYIRHVCAGYAHRGTADARAGFFQEYFEAEERSAFTASPKVHVPLGAQVAHVGVHRHIQQNRVDTAILTLAKSEQGLAPHWA